MESEVIGSIVGILIALAAGFGFWVKFKRRFSEIVDLLMTLDAAWKDNKITDEEWNQIWEKLMRIISSAPKKDIGT